MKAKTAIWLWLFLLLPLPLLGGEFYQWTDSEGVIHFTDSLTSVPESLRNSPQLLVRKDSDLKGNLSEIPVDPIEPESLVQEPPPAEPEAAQPPQPVIYNPQTFNIIVVNSGVHRFKKRPCRGGDCRPVFRPNFNDRRYIHPSVFDGGSRQYIHPGAFQRKTGARIHHPKTQAAGLRRR